MKTPFTAEQLDWLNCRLPEYNARVDKTLPGISETGKMYAVTQATLFLKKWGQLMNATTYSEGKIKEVGPLLINILLKKLTYLSRP